LFAYQPRPFTPPGAWSGIGLAPATYYSNPKHPMAQFTPIDSALTQMTLQFPPIWHDAVRRDLHADGRLRGHRIGLVDAELPDQCDEPADV
jgi:hypothetical protein